MPRTKRKIGQPYKPVTSEVLLCLCSMSVYSSILLKHAPNSEYSAFLRWLVKKGFTEYTSTKARTIKDIAGLFKGNPVKVSDWIHKIYHDILELNQDMPALFRTNNIKVDLIFRCGKNSCYLRTSLPFIPRKYERFTFLFVRAKVGCESFWIEDIVHEISNDEICTTLMLNINSPNIYRDYLIGKASFHNHISSFNMLNMTGYQIDEALLRLYRE